MEAPARMIPPSGRGADALGSATIQYPCQPSSASSSPSYSPSSSLLLSGRPSGITSVAHPLSTTRPASRTDEYEYEEASLQRETSMDDDADDQSTRQTATVGELTRTMRDVTIDQMMQSSGAVRRPDSPAEADLPTKNPYADRQPHPSLAPEDVIEIQLGAMRFNDTPTPDAGIEICFRFASPANRMFTGPVARFQRMMHSPLYACMLHSDSIQFIPANTAGTKWRLTITKAGVTSLFLWSLSSQMLPPYTGCWMTDSVLLMQE